ncbi:MAG: DNA alkylation repair protein [Anaerolineae bacterium]
MSAEVGYESKVVEEIRKAMAAYIPNECAQTASELQSIWLKAKPLESTPLIRQEAREKLKAIGTPVPVLKAIGKEIGKAAKKWVNDFLPLIRLLWDEYGREGRIVAATALHPMELAEPSNVIPFVRELARTSISWEDCDQLAMEALEPIVRKRPEEYLAPLEPWVRDENKWVRRAGITVIGRLPMKRGEYTARCLEMVEPALGDPDRDVRRAVSFAIRMGARGDPAAVRTFIEKHALSTDPNVIWVMCDVVRSMTRKFLPEFEPLLSLYERWAADPTLSAKDRRSVESAVKTLRSIQR